MRPLAYFFLLPLFVLFFSSCQKEISGEIARPTDTTRTRGTGGTLGSSFLVKTYTEDITTASGNLKVTFDLKYDISDRIVSMISRANAGDKFVYQYSANKFTMDLFNSNVLSIHMDCFLNNMQLIDSSLQYNDTRDTSTEKYSYNSAKQLTQKKEYEYNRSVAILIDKIAYEYDAVGNVVIETGLSATTTYTYATQVNNLNFGQIYFSQSKNLPTKTITSGAGGGTINHTYTVDSLNRVTSEKAISNDGNVLIRTYTY